MNRRRLWLAVLVLWGLWAIRAHDILALAIFVDESLHIMRAQVVYEFSDAKASILPAKLLLYYYLGLFNLQDVGGAWVARQAVALLAPLGAALSFALARQLFRRWQAGILAMAIYGLMPFMIFFERMALADSFAMIFGLVLAIVSVRLARRPSARQARIVGFWMGAALLAKLTTLPWAILPLLAAGLFGQWSRRDYWRHGVTVAVVAGALLLPSAAYMLYQEFQPPENKVESVEQDLFVVEDTSRLVQIRDNIETYAEAVRALFSAPFLVLILVLGGWQMFRMPREGGYLLAFTLTIWIFVVLTAARPSTRYLVLGVPGLLILAAGGLDRLGQLLGASRLTVSKDRRGIIQAVAIATTLLLLLWGGYSLRFALTAWADPVDLPLAERDIWEYYENSASGYALRAAAQDLPDLSRYEDHPSGDPIPVAGFVGACHVMRLYLPADSGVGLHCPYFRWSPEAADATLAEWEARINQDGVWYVLADVEQPMDVLSLPLRWEELAFYPRPYDGIDVRLYRVWAVEE
ncbi:MAG: hypothetical protein GYB66_01665, partial [Chloroflexi bacterium]|nr:hypothetical protein [Chloroflexota bacterium]